MFTRPKPQYALSLKTSKLQTALKHINKCLHSLVSTLPPIEITYWLTSLNKHITKATTLSGISIPSLTPISISPLVDPDSQTSYYKQTIKIIRAFKTNI